MQQPTCKNVRIRSTQDAHRIFYAVQKGVVQMVTRRLDANERLALTTGCVYAWEERGPHSEVTGLGIERFTEGRRWSPSRVRDEFLFYYEKYTPHPDANQLGLPIDVNPPRNWDPLVKQTYSVWVETPKGRRKWHLTAYFTQTTVDDLSTIDDIQGVRELVVPPGLFKSTRIINKTRQKSEEQSARSGHSSSKSSTNPHIYAPFPSFYNRYPSELASAPSVSDSVTMYEPYPNSNANPYPTQYSATSSPPDRQSVFLHPAQGVTQSPQPYPSTSFPPPATHYENQSNANSYAGPSPSISTGSSPSAIKPYQPSIPEYRGRPQHAPSNLPYLPSPSQWNIPSNEPFNTHLPPLYEPQASYTLSVSERASEHPLPPSEHSGSASPSNSNISDIPRHRRNTIPSSEDASAPRLPMLDSPYELHQQPSIPNERRGSIGPDRGLASMHALTRRHPYRRDPLDDRALRLLPPN